MEQACSHALTGDERILRVRELRCFDAKPPRPAIDVYSGNSSCEWSSYQVAENALPLYLRSGKARLRDLLQHVNKQFRMT
jgi:hypothetical protein